MVLVNKRISEAKNVMFVVGIALIIQLRSRVPVRMVDRHGNGRTYQFEYGHLHHTLIEIGRFILDHLDRNNFMCFHILTLDHLAKCPLAQNIKDQVSDRGTSVPT